MKKFSHPLLIGCGILKKEVEYIIANNHWELDTFFLDSALHVDFQKLYAALESALNRFLERDMLIFYGTCHPHLDALITHYAARRINVQNCIEILLGKERFSQELASGAFFLLEDWVDRWNYITRKAMGDNIEGIHMILRDEHNYFLAIRTPLSGNFMEQAHIIGREVGLPVKWLEVSLEHMEKVLQSVLEKLETKQYRLKNQPG